MDTINEVKENRNTLKHYIINTYSNVFKTNSESCSMLEGKEVACLTY